MGLHYSLQTPVTLIGSKNATTLALTSTALTTSYQSEASDVPTKTFATGGMSRIEFLVKYTMGASESSNSLEIKLDASNDRTNFFQLVTDSTSGGTSTLASREWTIVGVNASDKFFNFGVETAYEYLRISCKETGVSANAGSVYVEALVSGK